MLLQALAELPLLGILRGVTAPQVEPLAAAARSAGLRCIEVAMNTPAAADRIRELAAAAGHEMVVGAGTVLTPAALEAAVEAGAAFVVLPTLVEAVARACRRQGLPFLPGALTPTEIRRAWQAGAAMVKVFPARAVGPSYFREIHGPFPEIPLLACGGVTAADLGEYLAQGAAAAAVGASVFSPERLARGEYDAVAADLAALARTCRTARRRR